MSQRGAWHGHLDYPVIASLQLLCQGPGGPRHAPCLRLGHWEAPALPPPGTQPRGILTRGWAETGDPAFVVLPELNHRGGQEMLSSSPLHPTSTRRGGKRAPGSRAHRAGAVFFPPGRGNTEGCSCGLCCSCLLFHLLSDAALAPATTQGEPAARKHFGQLLWICRWRSSTGLQF